MKKKPEKPRMSTIHLKLDLDAIGLAIENRAVGIAENKVRQLLRDTIADLQSNQRGLCGTVDRLEREIKALTEKLAGKP